MPKTTRLRRALLIGGVSLVAIPVVLLGIVLPLVVWAADLGGVVGGRIAAMKPAWEETIGRKIDVGAVTVKLFPTLSLEVKDVAIRAEEEPPKPGAPAAAPDRTAPDDLFRVSALRVGVATWPLL